MSQSLTNLGRLICFWRGAGRPSASEIKIKCVKEHRGKIEGLRGTWGCLIIIIINTLLHYYHAMWRRLETCIETQAVL